MNEFVTIKVRRALRLWLKQQAAIKDVPMYVLLETLVVKSCGGEQPWPEPGSKVDSGTDG